MLKIAELIEIQARIVEVVARIGTHALEAVTAELRASRADRDLIELCDSPLLLAILVADDRQVTEQLLSASSTNVCYKGWSALMMAVSLGNVSAVRTLCENPAVNVNYPVVDSARFNESHAYAPLYLALHGKRKDCIRALLARIDCDLEVRAVLPAVMRVEPGLVRNHHTPLTYAAQLGDADAIQLLLDRGADAKAMQYRGALGLPALKHAVLRGHEAVIDCLLRCESLRVDVTPDDEPNLLQRAIAKERPHRAQRLVALGIDINAADPETLMTPLMMSVRMRDQSTLEMLLRQAALNVNACLPNGDTALILACKAGNVSAVEALIKDARVDPEIRNHFGMTALHVACDERDAQSTLCVQVLVESRRVAIDAKRDIAFQDTTYSYSPLLLAATERNTPAVRLLLQGGACIDTKETLVGASMLYVLLDALAGSEANCQVLVAALLPGLSMRFQLRCARCIVAEFSSKFNEKSRSAEHTQSAGRIPWLSDKAVPSGFVEISADDDRRHLSYALTQIDKMQLAAILLPLKDALLSELETMPCKRTQQRIATMATQDRSSFYYAVFHARVWPWPFRAPAPSRGRLGAVHALLHDYDEGDELERKPSMG